MSSLFSKKLYSIVPELADLDAIIGPVIKISITNDIKDRYSQQLSNSASFEDLFITNPNVVFNYINTMESAIVAGNTNHLSNVIPYVTQKISILESVYSNLMQSSTQSS